jgi:hypothetical protein
MKPLPLARPVGIRRMVQVCAWCPPAIVAAQTAALRRMGHCVSHGICADCAAELRGEAVRGGPVKTAVIAIMPCPTVNTFRGIES